MHTRRQKVIFGTFMVLLVIVMVIVYIFLHELSHVLAILAVGGRVDRVVFWGFRARVYFSDIVGTGAYAFVIVAGELLPLIFFLFALAFYDKNAEFSTTTRRVAYHFFYAIFAAIFVLPLTAWVFLFWTHYYDPIRFILLTGMHPLLIAFVYLSAIFVIGIIIYKKGLFSAIKREFKEALARQTEVVQKSQEQILIEQEDYFNPFPPRKSIKGWVIITTITITLIVLGAVGAYLTNSVFWVEQPY